MEPTPPQIRTISTDLQKGLRELRFFAATHPWKSAPQEREHATGVSDNIATALEKYHDHVFTLAPTFLRNLFLAYDDHVTCKPHFGPLLADGNAERETALAKYLHVVQEELGEFPTVRQCFFEDPNKDQEIITFVLGEVADAIPASTVGLGIAHPFPHTFVTLPYADTAFYQTISGFPPLTPKPGDRQFLREPPRKADPFPHLSIPEPSQIWNGKETTEGFTKLISKLCGESLDAMCKSRVLRTSANLSIILQLLENGNKCAYHYYYFRPLPRSADQSHRFGQGLLSWGTDAFLPDDTELLRLCQSMAVTGCTLFSRLADAAMPVYTRNASVFLARQALLSRTNLSWLAEKVLIPVLLEGRLESKEIHKTVEYEVTFQQKHLESISIEKQSGVLSKDDGKLSTVINDLCRLSSGNEQAKHLAEVLRPLRPEGLSAGDLALLEEVDHTVNAIKPGLNSTQLATISEGISSLETRCGNSGPLFSQVAAGIRLLATAFPNFAKTPAPVNEAKQALLDETGLVRNRADKLLARLCEKFKRKRNYDDVQLCCSSFVAASPELPQTGISKRPLPIYLSNLETALDALGLNQAKWHPNGKVSVQVYYGPEWFAVVWAEDVHWQNGEQQDGWEVWRKEVLKSVRRKSVSRGLPLVLAMALESAADLVWVSFDNLLRPLAGDNTLVAALENDGLSKTAMNGAALGYALGFAYRAWPPKSK